MRSHKQTPATIPDEYRFINLYDVEYYIMWERLGIGHSFFLKTTATAQEVKKKLKAYEDYLNIKLTTAQRCEFGCYGVRVWRIA